MDDRPPGPPTDGLLFIEEVALACRVSVSTVRHWVSRGKLRSFRPGRRRLVWRSDLERFLRGAGYEVVERER
jgi:excisionase family DNA binding protein